MGPQKKGKKTEKKRKRKRFIEERSKRTKIGKEVRANRRDNSKAKGIDI